MEQSIRADFHEQEQPKMNATSSIAPRAADSVKDFCHAHSITKVTFYKMQKEGTGPRIMKVGARTLISAEAAADWRRQCEEGQQGEHRQPVEHLATAQTPRRQADGEDRQGRHFITEKVEGER